MSRFCFVLDESSTLVITVDRINQLSTGGFFAPNNVFFNLNDASNVTGYVRSVTVQYDQARLPTSSARVWIYGIVPIPGGFKACSQYMVPSSQISTVQALQTYTIPASAINVFNGAHVAVGIQDTSASIGTVYSGVGMCLGGANLTSAILQNQAMYFRPDDSLFGVKLSYTVVA